MATVNFKDATAITAIDDDSVVLGAASGSAATPAPIIATAIKAYARDGLAVGDVTGAQSADDVATIVAAAIADVVDSAPGTLDTLNELAAALGDDANFAGSVTTALAGKLASDFSALSDAGTLDGTEVVALSGGEKTTTQAIADLASVAGVPAVAGATFSATGGTVTILDSFNIASITRSAAGKYRVTFVDAMATANYHSVFGAVPLAAGNICFAGYQYGGSKTTALCDIQTNNTSGTLADLNLVTVVFFE